MASLRETIHVDFLKTKEPNNTNPMSRLSCVHSDCENNENRVYISETVIKEDFLIDDWMQFNESLANFNSGLSIPGHLEGSEVKM